MKNIVKKIREEAMQITKQKDEIKNMYEKLMQEQKDINEQVNEANKIKEKDDIVYKQILSDVGKNQRNIEIVSKIIIRKNK